MDIFVSSIPFKLKDNGLKELFEPYGKVNEAKVIIDKRTRLSKGFGFVSMPDETEAKAAIKKLNGSVFMERTLVVSESEKKEISKTVRTNYNPFLAKKKQKTPWLAGANAKLFIDEVNSDKPGKTRKKRRGTGRGTTY